MQHRLRGGVPATFTAKNAEERRLLGIFDGEGMAVVDTGPDGPSDLDSDLAVVMLLVMMMIVMMMTMTTMMRMMMMVLGFSIWQPI